MSYEGYEQILCKNGHYWNADCHDFDENELCHICKEPIAWWNSVDVTNGSYDQDGTRIDRYVELEIKDKAKFSHCEHCGMDKLLEHETYKIPQRGIGCHVFQDDLNKTCLELFDRFRNEAKGFGHDEKNTIFIYVDKKKVGKGIKDILDYEFKNLRFVVKHGTDWKPLCSQR